MTVLKKDPPSATSKFSLQNLTTHFSVVTNRHPPLNPIDLDEVLNMLLPPPNPDSFHFFPFFFNLVTEKQVLTALKFTYSSSTVGLTEYR